MTVTAAIPARLGSTRLARKILADIQGRPLLWYVWQRVTSARRIDRCVVATDATEIREAVEGWGGVAIMTSPDCRSGTERIASVLDQLEGELIVNVQGDEPLIDPNMLDALVERWLDTHPSLVTPVYPLRTLDELQDPNIVKVVRAGDGAAIYFSRSPVPFVRDAPREEWLARQTFWGHVGVYAYSREVLAAYFNLPASRLEDAERLEQLKFLEAGHRFQTVETDRRPMAVDTAADLERVRQYFVSRGD